MREKRLIIEKNVNDRIYLTIGSKRRRIISKTELRNIVGEFIKEL